MWILAVNPLVKSLLNYSRRLPKPVKTSELCALERKARAKCQARISTSKTLSSTESFLNSWLRVEISPTTVVQEVRVFMELSSQMKTSNLSILAEVSCLWLTLVLEAMGLNSSCALDLLLTWMASTLCLVKSWRDWTFSWLSRDRELPLVKQSAELKSWTVVRSLMVPRVLRRRKQLLRQLPPLRFKKLAAVTRESVMLKRRKTRKPKRRP